MNKTVRKPKVKTAELPDTTDAERWLDADRFTYKGNTYRIVNNRVQKEE